jgi:lipopolysaccharide heptosyltransferase II
MGLFRFSRELRVRQFDLVIDLQGLFRSGWLAWETGSAVRVGFANARELAPIFYTHRVPVETTEQHAIDRYLTVADALGCGREPVEFRFATNDDDRRAVTELLNDDTAYAVLLPGTNWATKRWPAEHFAALVEPLCERFGLRTVIAGGPGDVELAKQIPGAFDLTGKTNLRQLVALLERAAVVVANDSGPMHIASALGRPLVTPYGPTSAVRTGPYRRMDTVIRLDIPCSPCFSRTCSHQSCLKWLGPEPVLREVERQLGVPTTLTSTVSPPAISLPARAPDGP